MARLSSQNTASQPQSQSQQSRTENTLRLIKKDWGDDFHAYVQLWPTDLGERLVREIRSISKVVHLSTFAPRINALIAYRSSQPHGRGKRATKHLTLGDVKEYKTKDPLPEQLKASQNAGGPTSMEAEEEDEDEEERDGEDDGDGGLDPQPESAERDEHAQTSSQISKHTNNPSLSSRSRDRLRDQDINASRSGH